MFAGGGGDSSIGHYGGEIAQLIPMNGFIIRLCCICLNN